MDSSVCVAAKVFYKGKEEEIQKDFGVVRVPNKTRVNGTIPPYVFKFDNGLVKLTIKFKANEEVDVLDEKDCFVRAKVNSVTESSAKVTYNGENRS